MKLVGLRGMVVAASFASTIAVAQDATNNTETPAVQAPAAQAPEAAAPVAAEVPAAQAPEAAAPVTAAPSTEAPTAVPQEGQEAAPAAAIEADAPHILARLGDAGTQLANVLFVYSKIELVNAKFGLSKDLDGQIALQSNGKQPDDYFVYRSAGSIDPKVFSTVIVSADLPIGQRFVDIISLNETNELKGLVVKPLAMVACLPKAAPAVATLDASNATTYAPANAATVSPQANYANAATASYSSAAPAQSVGQLDERTILYGASWIDPNTLAQARAKYMADRGLTGHLGNGFVMTNRGMLSEGTGKSWSSGGAPSTPGTCVANNGSAAVGDGVAQSGNSMTRVRLYDSPTGTHSPGGMGGNRGGRGLFRR